MRIEQLNYFLEVVYYGSFSLASENLHISQQALSSSLKNLERELGVSLLKRSQKGVLLTQEGELILSTVKNIVEKYNQMLELINKERKVQNFTEGKILIYSNAIYHMSVLTNVVERFCKYYPNIKIEIINTDLYNIIQILDSSLYDENIGKIGALMLTYYEDQLVDDVQFPNKLVNAKTFNKGKYYCVASKKSNIANKKQITMKTLVKNPFVIYNNVEIEKSNVYGLLKKFGTPKIAIASNLLDIWYASICKNLGVSLLHEAAFENGLIPEEYKKDLVQIPIKENVHAISFCLVPERTSKIVDYFIEYIPQIR